MTENTVLNTIQIFIRDDLLQLTTHDFSPDSNLLYFGLDSLKMMRLVVFLEESFKITINDEDVNSYNMETVRSIAKLIDHYRCNTNP